MNQHTGRLALLFVLQLEADGVPLQEVALRNRRYKELGLRECCASHEYCDANMSMLAAWTACYPDYAFDADNDQHREHWGMAWDRAAEVIDVLYKEPQRWLR